MNRMEIYGIIGFPLGHSCSPRYFNEKFSRENREAEYLSFEIRDIHKLKNILAKYPCLQGFNVTIPHKQNIIPLLDEISEEARNIGAVNCVKVRQQNNRPYLIGYNTDVYGFQKALIPFIPSNLHKALILGNGGAAKAVRYALHSLNIESITVSRTPRLTNEISYAEVKNHLSAAKLIINTTPLGTWPQTEEYPQIPYEKLSSDHYLFDLVYNPAITSFMKYGAQAGAHICNGKTMWLRQAEKNWEIWK